MAGLHRRHLDVEGALESHLTGLLPLGVYHVVLQYCELGSLAQAQMLQPFLGVAVLLLKVASAVFAASPLGLEVFLSCSAVASHQFEEANKFSEVLLGASL
jgi:hypothetical protein